MRLHHAIVAAVSMAFMPTTHAVEYTSAKPLLLQAIDTPDGRAQGEIVGPMADKFRLTTKSSASVIATVTTIKSFKQDGCKRLQLVLRQAGVQTTSGTLAAFEPTYTLNLCRDGSPPTEGMDLDAVGKALQASGRAGE